MAYMSVGLFVKCHVEDMHHFNIMFVWVWLIFLNLTVVVVALCMCIIMYNTDTDFYAQVKGTFIPVNIVCLFFQLYTDKPVSLLIWIIYNSNVFIPLATFWYAARKLLSVAHLMFILHILHNRNCGTDLFLDFPT